MKLSSPILDARYLNFATISLSYHIYCLLVSIVPTVSCFLWFFLPRFFVEESQSLEIVKTQKDLRLNMSSNLSVTENCRKRVNNGRRFFYALQRNSSLIANMPTKLYAFFGNVALVLSYAFRVWYPSKREPKALESTENIH